MFYLAIQPGGLGVRGGLAGTASSTNWFEGRGTVPNGGHGEGSRDGRREDQWALLSLRSGHTVGPS